MPHRLRPALNEGWQYLDHHLHRAWHTLRDRGPGQIQFWVIALAIGLGAGLAAMGFRIGISTLQELIYGADDRRLASVARDLAAWRLILPPIIGGLVVGLILHRTTPDGRVRSVADVIEGAALEGGRVEGRAGLGSAAASLITLGTGGSAGREGPVVHLAAVMSSWLARRINASPMTGRELLGCAVAGAVAASFNAPIAGALFAHEVILRHFAVHAFAPIAISAVAGTVINRMQFGGQTEFILPTARDLAFYGELPAFMLLGLLCALVAAGLIWGIFRAETLAQGVMTRSGWPRWLRPALAGGLLGLLAIPFPHIIGVGYETTWLALTGNLALGTVVIFALVKALAVAITFGGRMGGGIFSPSLVLGALTGLGFGMIATTIYPEAANSTTLYALAGMGGVAAAVLGAPISTAMIVFEMTGDWQTGIAIMTTVSLSSALASRLVHRSFFLTQLERRGVKIAEGPQVWLPQRMRIAAIMRGLDSEGTPAEELLRAQIRAGRVLDHGTRLDAALRIFDEVRTAYLPVTRPPEAQVVDANFIGPQPAPQPEIVGVIYHVDALRALNQALSEAAAEEHG